MLDRAAKEKIVNSIKADIENARGLFVTNLIGVPSNDAVAIRKGVREAAGKIVVTRNTLFKKAAEGTAAEKLFSDLKGPHAVAFAFEDAPGVAKCLKNAGKEFEVINFRGGLLNGEELTVDQVNALADLPGRDEMLGTVLATMLAPVSAFARLLTAIIEKKEEGADAAPAATEETAE